jgi:uncharacterized DUF497 family protein
VDKIKFVWNEKKSTINKKKHGIDFSQAMLVHYDPYALWIYDIKHSSSDEYRWIILGTVNDAILFVVETEIDENNTIRIISARPAIKQEREIYYENRHNQKK